LSAAVLRLFLAFMPRLLPLVPVVLLVVGGIPDPPAEPLLATYSLHCSITTTSIWWVLVSPPQRNAQRGSSRCSSVPSSRAPVLFVVGWPRSFTCCCSLLLLHLPPLCKLFGWVRTGRAGPTYAILLLFLLTVGCAVRTDGGLAYAPRLRTHRTAPPHARTTPRARTAVVHMHACKRVLFLRGPQTTTGNLLIYCCSAPTVALLPACHAALFFTCSLCILHFSAG